MIKLDNIYAGYSDTILKDINLEFEKGKITSIIGTNGSGKSTLLRVITSFLAPSKGNVYLDNINLRDYKLNEISKHISILPQVRNIPDITVEALISQGRFPHTGFLRKLTDNDKRYIKSAIKTVNIEKLTHKNVKDISGGERQKVFIAMILAQNTDIVLLDEPTTFLDTKYQIEIMNLIRDLNKSGKTIIMVLHDLNHAINYSDKICVLNDGVVVEYDSPNKLVEQGTIDKVFNIKTEVINHNNKNYYFFE